jgi:O-succinylhomoserine sulfhydrylase
MTDSPKTRLATDLIHAGRIRTNLQENSEALFLTSGFVYDSAEQAEAVFTNQIQHYQYTRFSNPTVAMFEAKLAKIEGADVCRATATGMAAVSAAVLCGIKAGQRVVASRALFGSCHWIISTLLPQYGVETVFVDGANLAEWREALSKPTAVVLVETPSNPMLDIIDLRAVSE